MSKLKIGNKSLARLKEIEKEIKRLQTFLPNLEGAVDDNHKKFLIEQANSKFRKRGGYKKLQISMVKSDQTLQGKIKQLTTEADRVKKHLGTHHLTKGSRVPSGYTWRYKPEPGKNYMINPDYVADYDPIIIDRAKQLKIKQNNTRLNEVEEKQNKILNPEKVNSDTPINNALQPSGLKVQSGDKIAMAVKKSDPAPPSNQPWYADMLPRGHTIVGADKLTGSYSMVGGKNSVKNQQALRILNRAKNIDRAYASQSAEAKLNILKDPMTQLELEA